MRGKARQLFFSVVILSAFCLLISCGPKSDYLELSKEEIGEKINEGISEAEVVAALGAPTVRDVDKSGTVLLIYSNFPTSISGKNPEKILVGVRNGKVYSILYKIQ